MLQLFSNAHCNSNGVFNIYCYVSTLTSSAK